MSTDAQLKGDSLRRQVELSKAYCLKRGLQLVEDFTLHDIGVSAFKGDNAATGQLGKFLQALDAGRIAPGSFLLVESLDRLTRQSVSTAVELLLGITRKGVTIVTLFDEREYGFNLDMTSLIVSISIMSRANEESVTKSQRISAAWNAKRQRAATTKLTKIAPAWLQLSQDGNRFIEVENRVAVVRRIFDMALSGHGILSISRLLNKSGVPTFNNSSGWHESYIQKILANRAVLGEFQAHTRLSGARLPSGPVVKDYYPQIVEEETFLAVASLRRGRIGKGGRKGPGHTNLFSHLAACAYCGAPMLLVNKGPGSKGGNYLRCSAARRGHRCAGRSWRYESFEKSVLFFLRELDLGAALAGAERGEAQRMAVEHQAAARERIRLLEVQRANVFELTKSQSMATDFILRQLDEIEVELTTMRAELSALTEAPVTKAATPRDEVELKRLIEDVQNRDSANIGETRQKVATALRSVVKSLRVGPNGVLPTQVIGRVEDNVRPGEVPAQLAELLGGSPELSAEWDNPFFELGLEGDQSRIVVVDRSDPTSFVHFQERANESITLDRHLDPDGVTRPRG